jgi:coenzyme F420-reducing hydrogenase alpha subunit
MTEYSRKTEQEKNDIINKLNQDVKLVQTNYDQSKNFYQQQKLIAQSEQSITLASSFLEKMKNILENKNNVFKSLLEQNYFILKKKLKECENIKEIETFSNRDVILNKISELLNMVFYADIYQSLINDITVDKETLQKYLNELINKCDDIIKTLNSEKKTQLGIYLCHPNFN